MQRLTKEVPQYQDVFPNEENSLDSSSPDNHHMDSSASANQHLDSSENRANQHLDSSENRNTSFSAGSDDDDDSSSGADDGSSSPSSSSSDEESSSTSDDDSSSSSNSDSSSIDVVPSDRADDPASVYHYFRQDRPEQFLFQNLFTAAERWAPSTIHKYSWVKRIYHSFCTVAGQPVWPISPEKATAFIRFIGLEARYKLSTIKVDYM